jgi:hypothetical protein
MPKQTSSKAAPAPAAQVESTKSTKKSSAKVEAVVAAPAPVPVETKKTKSTKATAVAAPAPVEAEPAPAVDTDKRCRYFKCVYDGKTFGRFSGYKPAACKKAASKALTSILRSFAEQGLDNTKEINFSMVECTRGHSHKVSNYTGRRVKLDKPLTVSIKSKNADGTTTTKTIEYKFKNKISKVKNQAGAAKPKTERKAKTPKAAKPAKKAAKTTKKGGAKKATATPVVEAAPVAPVVATPAATTPKRGGKAAVAATPAPVAAPAPAAPAKKVSAKKATK